MGEPVVRLDAGELSGAGGSDAADSSNEISGFGVALTLSSSVVLDVEAAAVVPLSLESGAALSIVGLISWLRTSDPASGITAFVIFTERDGLVTGRIG